MEVVSNSRRYSISYYSTLVSLFLDEACSEGERLGTDIPVDAETSSLPISIPTYVKTLYAQYETTNNSIKKVARPVVDGRFSLNITDAKVNKTRAITRGHDIEDDTKLSGGVIYHPKNGWGQSCLKTSSRYWEITISMIL